MELNKTLDFAIMYDEIKKNPKLQAGYTANGKPYDNYIENKCFNNFVKNMKTQHSTAYEMYCAGGGKELEERKVGENVHPPKMASFGSSSRMIYNLMKDKEGFLFEKQLHTTVGGIANLDGFMENNSKYIGDSNKPISEDEDIGYEIRVKDKRYEAIF